MANFEDFGKKLSAFKQTTVQKTQNAVEISKLKSAISSNQKKLDEYYAQIGKLFYEDNKDNHDAKFDNLFRAVKNCLDENDSLNAKINAIETMKLCPKCGKPLDDGNTFCTNCGSLIK